MLLPKPDPCVRGKEIIFSFKMCHYWIWKWNEIQKWKTNISEENKKFSKDLLTGRSSLDKQTNYKL
jgi:hypothetical protein